MVLWLAIAAGSAWAGPRHDLRVAAREERRAQVRALETAERRDEIAILEELIAATDDGTLPLLEPTEPVEPAEPTTLASR
jgi:hypothetical protein